MVKFANELAKFVYYRCVAKGTRLLTTDLRWIPAEDFKIGDELLGFDEYSSRSNEKPYRQLRRAKVTDTSISTDICYTVATDYGNITVSTQHPFLAKVKNETWRWVKVEELKPGSKIQIVCPYNAEQIENGNSWLAGIMDGEGSLSIEYSSLQIAQNEGIVEQRIIKELESRKFVPHRYQEKTQHRQDFVNIKIHKTSEVLRALASIRPMRLLKKWEEKLDRCPPCLREMPVATVKSIVNAGMQEIVSMETSTSTFIAQGFACHNTYSRWRYDLGRRENWDESVDRLMQFYREVAKESLSETDYTAIRNAVLNFEVMPSMRLMWTAGEAVKRNHFSAYNCSFRVMDSIDAFHEVLYILMHGTGVGISVERKYIEKLPAIKPASGKTINVVVDDSKEGWASSLKEIVHALWNGDNVTWDVSKLRPKGAILKTFGGRSSGPEPLVDCFMFFNNMITKHRGRKLSSINVHDLICKTAEVVVVGGVRRSAIISLSDLYDIGMRGAKDGQFWLTHPYRAMANNSAVYDHKPSATNFMEEWLNLAKSGTGERGIVNFSNLAHMLPKRRDASKVVGVNPCTEVLMRTHQLCNLTEGVIRPTDTFETLMEKIRIATIMGTIQAKLTDFGDIVSKEWKKNCEEERLLGVSLTGQMDNPALLTPDNLQELRDYAIGVNVKYAKKLGIKRAAAITLTKPSGTVSQLVDSSSGFHTRYAKFYIRRVRISGSDPLYKMMKDQGVQFRPENNQTEKDATTWVCSFAVKSPDNAITRNDMTAVEQLEQWLKIKTNWAEHTVSATIYVGDEEWFEVGNWVYEHFDDISGLSFLPKDSGLYQQAPYEEITEQQYNELKAKEPIIDYSQLSKYELEDMGEGSGEQACTSDKCEIKRR